MDSVFEMWWPRLEGKIAEILSTHYQSDEEPRRPDRDLLEEILQLTRANLSREPRPHRIHRHDIEELVHSLMECVMMCGSGDGEMSRAMLMQLRQPLKHLCYEAGEPELYKRCLMMLDERLHIAAGRSQHERHISSKKE
jgi:hypothetical protein